jgi:K+-sensing histidine kinase KdpD
MKPTNRISHERRITESRLDVRKTVSTIIECLNRPMQASSIRLELDIEEGLDLPASERSFARAIDQLIRFAMHRCEHDGELLVSARVRQDRIDFEVADSGAPIANSGPVEKMQSYPNEIERARRLVALLGGQVSAVNCPQGGVAWTITLPSTPSQTGNTSN